MIRYCRNKDIDRARWDECIRHSLNSLMYGYSWYLDEVCEDWDALVIDDYEAVFPIPFSRRCWLRYSLHPLFCQQLGLFSTKTVHFQKLPEVLAKIPGKFLLVKCYLNYMNPFPGSPRPNLILELSPAYEELRSNFKANCLRNLDMAGKARNSLLSGLSTADFLVLYRETTGRKDPLLPEEYQRFGSLINTLASKGAAELVGIYSPVNQLCAAGVFMNDGRRIYYIAGCSDAYGRKTCASFGIIDHIIKKYAGQNLVLDFEGSAIEGVANFFRSFGSQEAAYWEYTRNGLPGPFRAWADRRLGTSPS